MKNVAVWPVIGNEISTLCGKRFVGEPHSNLRGPDQFVQCATMESHLGRQSVVGFSQRILTTMGEANENVHEACIAPLSSSPVQEALACPHSREGSACEAKSGRAE